MQTTVTDARLFKMDHFADLVVHRESIPTPQVTACGATQHAKMDARVVAAMWVWVAAMTVKYSC